ncbi:MAG: hypothetical protein Q8L02_01340 [Candidatus Nitrotoga sp.]|nr:hypothetical protein [Candidatus Nitrotoga sp.]
MADDTPEVIAERAVLSWLYLADTQQDHDALTRLVRQRDAILAWHKLKLKISLPDSFYSTASSIGRAAVCAHLSPAEKLIIQENRESATEAAHLAEKLCRLIDFNSNLHPIQGSIQPPLQQAALDRILGGVLDQAITTKSDISFSEEIELELDKRAQTKREEENDPIYGKETARMIEMGIIHRLPEVSTSDAYKILSGFWASPADDLKERLQLFATQARRAAEFEPIVPRPSSENTDQHAFALSVCSILNRSCGTPNYEIAAAFISAVFDKDVAADTIKKWWQRRDSFYR